MDLRARLDRVTTDLLVPLRSGGRAKQVPEAPLQELMSLMSDFSQEWSDQDAVPRDLVGRLWFVFTMMLAEADHADQPDPILDAAWAYAEALRRLFGPTP